MRGWVAVGWVNVLCIYNIFVFVFHVDVCKPRRQILLPNKKSVTLKLNLVVPEKARLCSIEIAEGH